MKIKINQKPIELDAHFKYQCPKCGAHHWLSLKETQTKNFKVVCDCNTVFIPKRISKIKILYTDRIKKKNTIDSSLDSSIPSDILEKCSKILMGYGFTKPETENMLKQEYLRNKTDDCVKLIKYTLESLGVKNNEQYEAGVI